MPEKTYKEMEEQSVKESKKSLPSKKLGMRWFDFYFSWRIYLGLFFSVLLFFQSLGNIFSLIVVLINMGLIATLLITFRKKKAWLYNYNVFLLATEGICFFLRGLTFSNEEAGVIIFSVIFYAFLGLLWFLLNYRYFRRRAFMFHSKSS